MSPDADLQSALDPMVILSLCRFPGSEEPGLAGWHFDTQAFPASGTGQDGAQLAA